MAEQGQGNSARLASVTPISSRASYQLSAETDQSQELAKQLIETLWQALTPDMNISNASRATKIYLESLGAATAQANIRRRTVDRVYNGGPNLPPDAHQGRGGGGDGGMPGIAERVARIEERLEHMPTKWALAIGVFAILGPVISVSVWLHTDLKSDMNKGFDNVAQQFAKVDARFEKIDNKLESLDGRLHNVETDTKVFNTKLDNIQQDASAIKAATSKR